jgi:hypothetical protein
MRPDVDGRHGDREDKVARRVALHGHARVAHEIALCFREGFELPEEDLLAEGEIDPFTGLRSGAVAPEE